MRQNGALKVPLTAAGTTAAGGVLKVENTFGADVIVTRFLVDVETGASGAVTIDAGVHATGAATSDTLIDGQSVQAAGVFDNVGNGGTNGKAAVLWKKGEFIVASASADAAGLVGHAYVDFIYR